MRTIPPGFSINKPSPEGEALGEQLARLTERALLDQRKKGPCPEPCATCAFRLGTFPNRCLATVADALKCAMEQEPFYCHEDKGHLCAGWFLAQGAAKNEPPVKCPWEFSHVPEGEPEPSRREG